MSRQHSMHTERSNLKAVFFLIFIIIFPQFMIAGEAERVLTWEDCLLNTLENHPDLREAREKIVESDASLKIAKSVLFPKINAGASFSAEENFSPGAPRTGYSYGITLRQLIFDGFASAETINAADSALEQERYNYFVAESDAVFRARTAFIELLKKQEYSAIAESLFIRRKSNYELVSMRYNAGRENRGSLLSATADRDRAISEVRSARREIELQKKILADAMGTAALKDAWTAKGELALLEKIDPDAVPDWNRTASQSPLLKKMEAFTRAAYHSSEASYSGYYPSVYAFLNAGTSGSDPFPNEKKISGGFEISIPVFEGGAAYYGTRKSASVYRQAKISGEKLKKAVLLTLEEKWTTLVTKTENAAVQEQYFRAAEERAKIAEAQYSIGHITFNNWTIIEDALASAMKNRLEAKISMLKAEAELIQAKGVVTDYGKK